MSNRKEILKVEDSKGFTYEVQVSHQPHFGFSTAQYRDEIIADCQLGRILEPQSDNDREWEMYEQRFSEWRDEIMVNLKPSCRIYFDQQNKSL